MNQSKKASIFSELIKQCPLCHQSIKGHSIARISSIILSEENQDQIAYLKELIFNHRWAEVALIQEYRNDADMKQYYTLNCPEKRMVLLEFIFNYEIWSDDYLNSIINLQPEDKTELEKLPNISWKSL